MFVAKASERENSIESHIPKLPCEMLKSRLYFTTRVELNIYDKMTAVQHRETISAPWNNCILNNGSLSLYSLSAFLISRLCL